MAQKKLRLADGLVFANRLVMAPVATNMADRDGCPTPEMIRFYEQRAAGGVGAVILGAVAVSEEGGVTRQTQRLHTDGQAVGLRALIAAVRRHCPVGVQLFHAGGQGNPDYTGFPLIAPSAYVHPPIGHPARAMSLAEISRLRDRFIGAALTAFASGADFVELHAAHGYLLHEFLSPHFNRRTDEYGIDHDGGLRLLREILDGIGAADPRLLARVGLRWSADDFVEDGLNPESSLALVTLLAAYPLLYLHVTAGIYDSSGEKKKSMRGGGFQKFAARFKAAANWPIMTVGNVDSLARAEEILAAGQADMTAMARALIADPELPAKSFAGREDMKKCLGCNRCHYLASHQPEQIVACRGERSKEEQA